MLKQQQDQLNKFNAANIKIADNIEVILEMLHLDYKKNGIKTLLACPIHGGDNKDACVIYVNTDVPNWKCYTHGCHNEGKSLVSFLKMVLQTDTLRCIKWIEKNFGVLEIDNNYRFNINVNTLNQKRKEDTKTIDKDFIKKNINPYVKFYLDKGFTKEVLNKYGVGIGNEKIEKMHNRIIVPVFNDDNSKCVGILGRTLYEKCLLCDLYHHKHSVCPTNKMYNNFSKWKNSPGFYCNSYLYNYWFAREYIQKTKTIILVEGQADVWKCDMAGIKNVVGIFGNTLTEDQKMLIEESGATRLITFLDPDSGGISGTKSIIKYAENMFTYYNIEYQKEPADCTVEELQTLLGKYQ